MHVEVRRSENTIIVDLQGHLVAGIGEEILHNVMIELVHEGWRQVLLNLTEVRRIDSAGIGELVASVRAAKQNSCIVKVLLVGGRVRDVLNLSQILPLLDIYEDEESALASFSESAAGTAAKAPAPTPLETTH